MAKTCCRPTTSGDDLDPGGAGTIHHFKAQVARLETERDGWERLANYAVPRMEAAEHAVRIGLDLLPKLWAERDAAIERGTENAGRAWQFFNAAMVEAITQCKRAEAAERRLKYHHTCHPLPKKPPQPVRLGDDYNPDLCRFCREADWEAPAEAQAQQKEGSDA